MPNEPAALDVTAVRFCPSGFDVIVRNLSGTALVIHAIGIRMVTDHRVGLAPLLEPLVRRVGEVNGESLHQRVRLGW